MKRRNSMHSLVAGGLLLASSASFAGSTLVYCSEGSPAGFDPGQYTTGTDYDATSETLFNRLVQFERGGTE
ncbi:ABC transporter substrate-binding protein, partial [Pseudomonas aeruginosa]